MYRKYFLVSGGIILLLSSFFMFWELDSVDLEASEDIYVHDSVGYLRGDPFITPRQHLRKPHAPASPHPFFVQLLTAEILRIFGLSLYSARIVQAGATVICTALVILLAIKIFNSKEVALASGLIFATLPIVIRYGRMAVLDPILMLVQALAMFWLWLVIKSNTKMKYLYSIFVGISLALSISTKLTGISILFTVLFFLVILIIRKHDFTLIKSLTIIIFSAIIVYLLFNDPYSYSYGWLHFEGKKIDNVTLYASISGILAFKYWYYFVISLIGIVPIILLVNAAYLSIKKKPDEKTTFFTIWLIAPLSYLLINPSHITGLSAEWAYLPLVLPLSLIMGKSLIDLYKNLMPKLVKNNYLLLFILYLIIALPNIIFYGLRFKKIPLPNLAIGRNVVRGDLAVTKIIQNLNQDHNELLVLIKLIGVDLPIWLLSSNIKTEPYYHPIIYYDYIVTDDLNFVNFAKNNNFFIKKQEKNPSETEVYLLSRN